MDAIAAEPGAAGRAGGAGGPRGDDDGQGAGAAVPDTQGGRAGAGAVPQEGDTRRPRDRSRSSPWRMRPSRPEPSRATGRVATQPATNVPTARPHPRAKPAGRKPAGSGLGHAHRDQAGRRPLGGGPRPARRARGSPAWLWPAGGRRPPARRARRGLGMKIEARTNRRAAVRAGIPGLVVREGRPAAPAADRSIEAPLREERPSSSGDQAGAGPRHDPSQAPSTASPPTTPRKAPASPSTEDRRDDTIRPRRSSRRTSNATRTRPSRTRRPKPEAEPALKRSPEAVL